MQRSKRGEGSLKAGVVGRMEPRHDSENGAGTALGLAANLGPTSLEKPVFCRNTNDCRMAVLLTALGWRQGCCADGTHG
ncbi:hypothetical protein CGRA01v4_14047 [Colletotrichum graminicola]|nr:hypothetical protein CGRA01v4_14047 [Colletotrichum graminicola]